MPHRSFPLEPVISTSMNAGWMQGLPVIPAPEEAEAMLGALEQAELTQLSITDDGDVLLFGGERVLRNRTFSLQVGILASDAALQQEAQMDVP